MVSVPLCLCSKTNMALSTITTEIVTLLGQIAGIGKVLEYSRYTPGEQERLETYVSGGLLNCWIVTREATATRDRGAGEKNIRDQHTIVIHGYRAVTSAVDSEKGHQNLVESVRDKLHDNRQLLGGGWLSTPVSVREFNAVMFFNAVLCWHTTLVVVAEEK